MKGFTGRYLDMETGVRKNILDELVLYTLNVREERRIDNWRSKPPRTIILTGFMRDTIR